MMFYYYECSVFNQHAIITFDLLTSRPMHARGLDMVGWLGFNGAFNTIQVISRL